MYHRLSFGIGLDCTPCIAIILRYSIYPPSSYTRILILNTLIYAFYTINSDLILLLLNTFDTLMAYNRV